MHTVHTVHTLQKEAKRKNLPARTLYTKKIFFFNTFYFESEGKHRTSTHPVKYIVMSTNGTNIHWSMSGCELRARALTKITIHVDNKLTYLDSSVLECDTITMEDLFVS